LIWFLILSKWILSGVRSPLTENVRALGTRVLSPSLFSFCFHLQTHQVLSEAGKADAEKREKLLDLYVRTEQILDQLDIDFIETLQKSLGDFKTTLKENIKNVKPRDQYIVLVAGKFLIRFYLKKRHEIIPIVFQNGF